MSNNLEETFRFTVPPALVSHLRIRSLPNAACIVRCEGAESPSILAYSDLEGFIDLYVRPAKEYSQSAKLVIEADGEGASAQHVLELRAARQSSAEIRSPSVPLIRRIEGAQVRPALSLDQVLRISDEELLEQGYPLRPDPDETPRTFDRWLKAVASPMIRVDPNIIARPDISYAHRLAVSTPASSYNWSGIVLEGAPGTYDWVSGEWHVPYVRGEDSKKAYSGMWIGLDGEPPSGGDPGTTDLVQCGTGQDAITFETDSSNINISTYYAWTQFIPQQQTAHQITNFKVNPGDHIWAQLYIADAGKMPSLSGYFGQMLMMNMTTSEFTWVYTPVGSTRVIGRAAEWIMERPKVNEQLTDLANYGSAAMLYPYARRVGGGYVYYNGATSSWLKMINGDDPIFPDILSTATPIDYSTLNFNWIAFS